MCFSGLMWKHWPLWMNDEAVNPWKSLKKTVVFSPGNQSGLGRDHGCLLSATKQAPKYLKSSLNTLDIPAFSTLQSLWALLKQHCPLLSLTMKKQPWWPQIRWIVIENRGLYLELSINIFFSFNSFSKKCRNPPSPLQTCLKSCVILATLDWTKGWFCGVSL